MEKPVGIGSFKQPLTQNNQQRAATPKGTGTTLEKISVPFEILYSVLHEEIFTY